MVKKKILFIVSKKNIDNHKKRINYDWVNDLDFQKNFEVYLWGPGSTNILTTRGLRKTVDKIKPDYIYCYCRGKLSKWLPDISSIKVPKIMVELDTYKYDPKDSWYKQFDKLLCRQNIWEDKHSLKLGIEHFEKMVERSNLVKNLKLTDNYMRSSSKKLYKKYLVSIKNSNAWEKIKLFRWSIREEDIYNGKKSRNGITFIGVKVERLYCQRKQLSYALCDKIQFLVQWDKEKYKNILRSSSALLCPTESSFGDFIPGKLFEFAASGAAIITNCNLKSYNMKDLDEVVIKYNGLEDLREKIKMDFSPYYDKASEVMRNHTHSIRYKEIFV